MVNTIFILMAAGGLSIVCFVLGLCYDSTRMCWSEAAEEASFWCPPTWQESYLEKRYKEIINELYST